MTRVRAGGRSADRTKSALRPEACETCPTTYRFGDGYLDFSSDDTGFDARFRDLYRECIVREARADDSPAVGCAVRAGKDQARIDFDDPEPLDQCAFATSLLAPHGYHESAPARPGWRTVRSATDQGRLDFRGGRIQAFGRSPWQSVVASLALHRVLRLQPRTLFFHAASVGVDGGGVLLFGAKGVGKTTLSLALAEAGHAFLGDEIAAVRTDTLELLPFRRRLSIRKGPACDAVRRALKGGDVLVTAVADGTVRFHLHADRLRLRRPAAAVPLRAAVVLRGQAAAPRLERFRPSTRDLHYFAPLESTTWLAGRGSVALRVLSLASRVPCYLLDLGPIPQTVALLVTLPE